MKKISFKVAEYEEHIMGYGRFKYPTEAEQLDAIIQKMPKKYKYIKHIMREHFVKYPSLQYITNMGSTELKIPYGRLEMWIDLYVEKR